MRRTCLIAMVAVVIFHLPGCFQSKVPMASSEKSKIEPKMVGDWIQVVDKKDKPPFRLRRVRIAKFNEREYFVSWAKENSDANMARVYSVNVGDFQLRVGQYHGRRRSEQRVPPDATSRAAELHRSARRYEGIVHNCSARNPVVRVRGN